MHAAVLEHFAPDKVASGEALLEPIVRCLRRLRQIEVSASTALR